MVENGIDSVLIDCGLFQGLKELRLKNWDKLPFNVSDLKHVILTHGHLDHTGYLPLLVKQGFNGKIHATRPTIEIAKLILIDSARIQEEDAERANKYKHSRHSPAKPLYTVADASLVFPLFKEQPVNEWMELSPHISFRMQPVGHIIGAVFVELHFYGKHLVFSGDVGRIVDPLMPAPNRPSEADVLIIESTYGNSVHAADAENLLARNINEALQHNGTIVIPAFAVERTQLLMYYIWKLQQEKRIPRVPVFVDTPLGAHVLEVFRNFPSWHLLSNHTCESMLQTIHMVKKTQETEKLATNKTPKIIIAGSGMATGGRVLTYFEHYIGNPEATIMLVGYQGEGTRGRALLDGATEIKMRGKWWPVKAKVVAAEGLSAHADQSELLGWMSELNPRPKTVILVHGEAHALTALRQKIEEIYAVPCIIPFLQQKIQI